MAECGQLVCVLAGPSAAVSRVKKYTKGVIARADIDFSDQPYGKATLLKIIGNTFVLNMVETLSEGHTIAEKSGLGCENLHTFIETMFPGPYVSVFGFLIPSPLEDFCIVSDAFRATWASKSLATHRLSGP